MIMVTFSKTKEALRDSMILKAGGVSTEYYHSEKTLYLNLTEVNLDKASEAI